MKTGGKLNRMRERRKRIQIHGDAYACQMHCDGIARLSFVIVYTTNLLRRKSSMGWETALPVA
eukprot:1337879-Pyramimonas_sp.AAC.1